MLAPPSILASLQHAMFYHYFLAAAVTLLVYDVCINLDAELRYIWPAFDSRKRPINKSSVIFNVMYLVQRYLPLVDQVILNQYILFGATDARACKIGVVIFAWCSMVGMLLSEFMLELRIWAVWERKKYIGATLIVFSLQCMIVTIIFGERFIEGIQYFEVPHISSVPQDLGRCLIFVTTKDILVCWISVMVCVCASFILMAIPGLRAYRTGGSSKFVKVVYRDGIIYYALFFLATSINVIVALILPFKFTVIYYS